MLDASLYTDSARATHGTAIQQELECRILQLIQMD